MVPVLIVCVWDMPKLTCENPAVVDRFSRINEKTGLAIRNDGAAKPQAQCSGRILIRLQAHGYRRERDKLQPVSETTIEKRSSRSAKPVNPTTRSFIAIDRSSDCFRSKNLTLCSREGIDAPEVSASGRCHLARLPFDAFHWEGITWL